MNKTLIALLGAGALALTAVAAPQDAYARNRGGAVAAGVIGGLAVGAILGGAIASSPPAYAAPAPAYAPVAGYEPYPTYYGAVPVECPGGYWARQPVHDGWGRVVGWSRPRFFCPAY